MGRGLADPTRLPLEGTKRACGRVTAPEPAPDADLSRMVAHPVEGHRPKA